MGRLDGKVALISGGAKGQGAAETRLFVREGAKVVFGDILDDEGKKVEAEIRRAGGEATYVHLNVTREADWRAAVTTAVERYGKLNVLVNNAGIVLRRRSRRRPRMTGTASWRSTSRACSSARSVPFRPCARPVADPSSISPRRRGWSAAPGDRRLHRHQGRGAALHQGNGGAAREGAHPL